jgi:hypothetical protein
MAEATYALQSRPDLSKGRTQQDNAFLTNLEYIDPNLIRPPEYFVDIFSVADRDLTVSQPGLNIPSLKFAHNPDCIKDKTAYECVYTVASPYHVVHVEQINGTLVTTSYTAERVALSLINPNQKTLSMDGYIQPDTVIGWGDDYIQRGLFFVRRERSEVVENTRTLNNGKKLKFTTYIPPKEEIVAAVLRKEKFYNETLDEAKSLEMGNPAYFREHLIWHPECHDACEYFGIETSWHQKRMHKAAPSTCPICKMDKPTGAAFHFLPNGRACVTDWDTAIASGAVLATDRPTAKSVLG